MTKNDLLEAFEASHTFVRQDTLDDLVHESFSRQAAQVNNSGPEEQLDWLLANGYTIDQLKEQLGL